MLDEIGDILFSVIVGYMGALEFFFIARHLYHWTMRHCQKYDENSLAHIQEQLKSAIAVAAEREKSGYNAMEDGVLYKDGFRIDPDKILENKIIGENKIIQEKQITQENKSSDNKKHEIMTHANDSLYPTQTLKTQFSQDPEKDKFSFKSKLPLNISEESIEPQSSKSSLSTQTSNSVDGPMISEELAREDPEGEPTQYPDDYLRSLDGLKNKPLTRDDGTGRRRAFKKRKSSDSSNSSRDSRTSRDEELKMFTSLEEKEQEKHDFVPIHYSEQNLKVKPRRRHKRSPGHDYKRPDSAGSLPIDEEEDYTFDLPTDEEQAREVRQSPFPTSNVHNSSSFEEATKDQHEDILSNMQQKGNAKGRKPSPTKESENVSMEDNSAAFAASSPNASNAFANETKTTSNPFPDQSEDHYDSSHSGGIGQADSLLVNVEMMENAVLDIISNEVKESRDPSSVENQLMRELSVRKAVEPGSSSARQVEDDLLEQLTNLKSKTSSLQEAKSRNLPKSEKEDIVNDIELEKRTRILEDEHLSNISKNIRSQPNISVEPPPEDEEIPKILEIRVLKVQLVDNNPRINRRLPEGVSTFYDFNTSASREPSVEPSVEIKTYSIQESPRESSEERSSRETSTDNFLNVDRSRRAGSVEPSSRTVSLNVQALSREPSVDRSNNTLTIERARREGSVEPSSLAVSLNVKALSREPSVEKSKNVLTVDKTESSKEPSQITPDKETKSEPLKVDTKNTYQRRLLEDISPFYDFNASVNPWFFKHDSISEQKPSKEDLEDGLQYKGQKQRKISLRSIRKQINKLEKGLEEGISDFFDFNVSICKSSSSSPQYSRSISKDKELPGIALPSNFQYDGPKCNTSDTRHLTDPFRKKSPSPKCYSADNSFLTMEILDNNFKRSTYVGESAEFADHLNYRREFTKTFRRSESKSPSPLSKIETNTRILNEEFKGAKNFSYDFDRRASDTALLQKNEIMFQIQDFDTISEGFEKDEDYLNGLQEDEYHHFRRYSLNQEFRVDEDDDYFIQEIEVRTLSGEKVSTWVNSSPFDTSPIDITPSSQESFDNSEEFSASVMNIQIESNEEIYKGVEKFMEGEVPDYDIIQEHDGNETGSEDERQTVFEAEDFISSSFKDLQEDEDSELLVIQEQCAISIDTSSTDHHENVNIIDNVNIITSSQDEYIEIDEIYEQSIKDRKQSGILREFESLISDQEDNAYILIDDPRDLVLNIQEPDEPIELGLIPLNVFDELLQNRDDTGSEDERLTVVEVDDGIVSDDRPYESYTEQSHSECEQADREAEQRQIIEAMVQQVEPRLIPVAEENDDSVIDKIYVDAIRNRKQSGILRDYDSLAVESPEIYSGTEDLLQEILGQDFKTVLKRSSSVTSEGSYYGSSDRKDRYLADANAEARNSVRQRARYGVTQKFDNLEEDFEVDMNYVPKKEYNWRKNFKIDEDDEDKVKEAVVKPPEIGQAVVLEQTEDARSASVISEGGVKKKKTKKKTRKSSKSSLDDEVHLSISPQYEEDDILGEHFKSPSVESRRSKSRFSLEELETRRSSINLAEDIPNDFEEEIIEVQVKQKKVKKIKRKKSKGDIKEENLGAIERSYLNGEISYETLIEFGGQEIQERRDSKVKTGAIKKKKKSKESFSPLAEDTNEVKQDGSNIFERHVETNLEENIEDQMNSENIGKVKDLEKVNMDESEKSKIDYSELAIESPGKSTSSAGNVLQEGTKESSNSPKAQSDSFDFVKDSGFYPLF